MAEKILRTEYSEEMQKSYLDYSMSVITARAIPDVRDGLKPVQRRVLYDMNELHLSHDKPHRKSARIVGDTMGKYHPHGDSSIYDTLVVMSQAFKKAMPLVDGHGNFGSIEGDGAAAMRYTEAKLQKYAEDVFLKDLDKTVEFVSNYDETEKEPAVLPVRVPNILINGADGIAVGMSTSIPPHNLGEVCDACIAYIKNRDITIAELLKIIKGPDFPTGGIIANKSELKMIYTTGVGKLKLRGRLDIELGKRKSDKDKLVVTEIPYTMIGAGINKFMMDVAALIESKKLTDVTDISNQSGKEGTRIVLELKKDADVEKIKNILYKKTKLEDTFGVNMLAIAGGRPETLDLKAVFEHYLDFQYECATKKYQVMLDKELEKKEIQEGLIVACDCIDVIIAVLRASKTPAQAKLALTAGDITELVFRPRDKSLAADAKKLHFTERQAQAILEMRLSKLIGLEIDALLKSHKDTLAAIKKYQKLLKSKSSMDEVFIEDLLEIKKEYATPRRTKIEDGKEAVYEEEPIAEEEVVFLMDRFGYCKVMERTLYDKNAETIESEYAHVVPVWNTDKICIFTSKGVMHQVKVLNIPLGKTKDKGTPIDNLSNYDSSKEEILCVTSTAELSEAKVLFATKAGLVKLVDGNEYMTNNKTVAATKLADGDELSGVALSTDDNADAVLVSDNSYVLRFPISEISVLGKNTKGYKGMKLSKGELLVGLAITSNVNVIHVRGRDISLGRLKQAHINSKGNKIRP